MASTTQKTVVISSAEPLPDHVLVGHAFDGVDVILGDDGYRKFRTATGRLIEPGGDGSYMVLNRRGDTLEIGGDHAGYMTIFVYRHRHHWAVSNSFLDLVSYVARQTRWPMTRDPLTRLNSYLSGPFGDVPTTLDTEIAEIRHLPAGWSLTRRRGWFRWRVTEVPGALHGGASPDHGTVQDSLRSYIREQVGRNCAMLNAGLNITCDLTGGRDSRTVVAVLLAAARKARIEPGDAVQFHCNKNHAADYAVARAVSDAFGLNLERPVANHLEALQVSREAAFETWKRFSYSAYYPIYFSSIARHPGHVWLGGGGGESHRRITGIGNAPSAEKLFERKRPEFPDTATFKLQRERIVRDLDALSVGRRKHTDTLKLYYRHFRERLHHGRGSRIRNMVSPLSGRHLRAASDQASAEVWRTGLLLADVIAATTPDLLKLPFDKTHEGFDASRLDEFDAAEFSLDDVDTSGRVFADEAPDLAPASHTDEQTNWEMLDALFRECEETAGIRSDFPEAMFTQSRESLNHALEHGSLTHPRAGKDITQIVQAYEVEKLMAERRS